MQISLLSYEFVIRVTKQLVEGNGAGGGGPPLVSCVSFSNVLLHILKFLSYHNESKIENIPEKGGIFQVLLFEWD